MGLGTDAPFKVEHLAADIFADRHVAECSVCQEYVVQDVKEDAKDLDEEMSKETP